MPKQQDTHTHTHLELPLIAQGQFSKRARTARKVVTMKTMFFQQNSTITLSSDRNTSINAIKNITRI
jgi:hypothetical protein